MFEKSQTFPKAIHFNAAWAAVLTNHFDLSTVESHNNKMIFHHTATLFFRVGKWEKKTWRRCKKNKQKKKQGSFSLQYELLCVSEFPSMHATFLRAMTIVRARCFLNQNSVRLHFLHCYHLTERYFDAVQEAAMKVHPWSIFLIFEDMWECFLSNIKGLRLAIFWGETGPP